MCAGKGIGTGGRGHHKKARLTNVQEHKVFGVEYTPTSWTGID